MRKYIVLVLIAFMTIATTAEAQQNSRSGGYYSRGRQPAGIELGFYYGYAWTTSQDATLRDGLVTRFGKIDVEDSDIWGGFINRDIRPGTKVEVLFQHQSSDLTFKQGRIKETLSGITVQHYHIGAVQTLKTGPVSPFTGMSLGMTRAAYDAPGQGDNWRFSVIPSIGVKINTQGKLGLKLQARLPIIITDTGIGVGCGTSSGCGASFGGTGITQFDLSAGLFLKL